MIESEGRVPIADAAQAVREAMVAHADCRARLRGLQGYVRDVVRPE